jgi:hypothetical protein
MLQSESAQADFAGVGVVSTALSKDLSVNQDLKHFSSTFHLHP